MKKIITTLLSFLIAFCLTGCNSSKTTASSSKKSGDSDGVKGAWTIKKSVDEFGDETDDDTIILASVASGDFSNTATSSSDLRVAVFIWTPDVTRMTSQYLVQLRLLEYKKTPATYLESSNMSMDVKVGDNITSYGITGDAPKGDLYVGLKDHGGDDIFNDLYAGKDVRTIVKIDSSQYNFTIKSSGFKAICKDAQKKQEAVNEKNRIKNGTMAIKAILNEDNDFEGYTWLKDNYSKLKLLSNDEINEQIAGNFMSVSMSQPKKDVQVVITYWYLMDYENGTKYQKYYFEEGANTKQPEKLNDKGKSYTIADGLIKEDGSSYDEYQVRKVKDGYYVLYSDANTNYSTPAYILIQYTDDASGVNPVHELSE